MVVLLEAQDASIDRGGWQVLVMQRRVCLEQTQQYLRADQIGLKQFVSVDVSMKDQ